MVAKTLWRGFVFLAGNASLFCLADDSLIPEDPAETLRKKLCEMKISDLKQRARRVGVSEGKISSTDDKGGPQDVKTALIELMMKHSNSKGKFSEHRFPPDVTQNNKGGTSGAWRPQLFVSGGACRSLTLCNYR